MPEFNAPLDRLWTTAEAAAELGIDYGDPDPVAIPHGWADQFMGLDPDGGIQGIIEDWNSPEDAVYDDGPDCA